MDAARTQGPRPGGRRVLPRNLWRQYGVLLAGTLALAAALYAAMGMRYLVNDDATISNIAAGAYGQDSQYLIYVNILLGWALKPFYALLPSINWFVVLTYGAALLTLPLVGVVLVRRLGWARGAIAYAAFALTAGFDLMTAFHYTKYAALFMVVGLLLIALHLGRWDGATFSGAALVFGGCLLRFDLLYPIGALAAALLLSRFFPLARPAKIKAAVTVAALLALCFAASAVDSAAYRADPRWAEYTEYNAVRTEISDYRLPLLQDTAVLEPLGFSGNDTAMLTSWNYGYSPVFATERLEQVSEAMPLNGPAQTARDSLNRLFWSLFGLPVHALFFAVLAGWLLFADKRRSWPVVLGSLAAFALVVVFLVWRGRYIDRVDYCFTMAAAVFIAAGVRWRQPPGVRVWALAAALLVAAGVPTYSAQRTLNADYNTSRPAATEMIMQAMNDKDHLYLMDMVWFDVAAGHDVWHAMPKGAYSNVLFLGGWTSRTPFQLDVLEAWGVDDPYAAALEREDIWYVDAELLPTLEQFLRDHYDPGAAIEQLPVTPGYRVYRFVPGGGTDAGRAEE